MMEKTEMMKKFEAETGKQSAIVKFMAGGQAMEIRSYPRLGVFDYSVDYISWLESKASAYDRLMSMNSVSENEIRIVLDGNAWCAYRMPFRNLQEDDAGFGSTPQMALTALLEVELPDGRDANHDNN